MSHTTTQTTEFKNVDLLRQAAARIGATVAETVGTVHLFSSKHEQALAVRIPGWQYPLAVQQNGIAHFDLYKGAWGDIARFKELKRAYVEVTAEHHARRMGRQVVRTTRQTARGPRVRLELR